MNITQKFKEAKQDYLDTCDKMVGLLDSYDTSIIPQKDKYVSQLRLVQKQISDEMIHIPVVAEMSSGKSTFLNALLFGENILDASIGETTAKAFKISYGEQYKIKIQDHEEVCPTLDIFKEKIKEINTIAREKISQTSLITLEGTEISVEQEIVNVYLVELFLPHEMLKNDIIIYDTPGFGSVNEKDMYKVLQSVLPIADGIIWLLDIAQGIKKSDIEMLAKLFQSDKIPSRWFVIYTKLDTVIEIEEFDNKDFDGSIVQIQETLGNHKEYQKYLKDNTKILNKQLNTQLEINKNLFTLGARRALRKPNSAYGILFQDFQQKFWEYIVTEKSYIIYEKLGYFTSIFTSIMNSMEEQANFAEHIGNYNEEELSLLKEQVVVLERIKNSYLPELKKQGNTLEHFQTFWNNEKETLYSNLVNEFSQLSESPKQEEVSGIYTKLVKNTYQVLVSNIDGTKNEVNNLISRIQADFTELGVTSQLSTAQDHQQYDLKNSVEIAYEKKQRVEIQRRMERVDGANSSLAGAAAGAAGAYVGSTIVAAATAQAAAAAAVAGTASAGLGIAAALSGPLGWVLIGGLALLCSSAGSSMAQTMEEVDREVVIDYEAFNPEQTARIATDNFFLNLESQGFYEFCMELIRYIELMIEQLTSECEHLMYISENKEHQENFVKNLKEKTVAVAQLKQNLLSLVDNNPKLQMKLFLEKE